MLNNYINLDKELFFYFNGVYSKDYNVIINKESRDNVRIVSALQPKIDFMSPMFSYNSYLKSNTTPQREISFNITLVEATYTFYTKIKSWLFPGNRGNLFFDTNLFWGYEAVLTNYDEQSCYIDSNNLYTVNIELKFMTVGLAFQKSMTSINQSTWWGKGKEITETDKQDNYFLNQVIGNEYGIPEIIYLNTTTNGDLNFTKPIDLIIPHTNAGWYSFSNDIAFIPVITPDGKLDSSVTYEYQIVTTQGQVIKYHFTLPNKIWKDTQSQNDTKPIQLSYNSYTGFVTIENKLIDIYSNMGYNLGIQLYAMNEPFCIDAFPITDKINNYLSSISKPLEDIVLHDLLQHNNQAYIAATYGVNNATQYGIHPYTSATNWGRYYYSFEGAIWYNNNILQDSNFIKPQLPIDPSLKSRPLQYYCNNYDTIQISLKQKISTTSNFTEIIPTTFVVGLQKYHI